MFCESQVGEPHVLRTKRLPAVAAGGVVAVPSSVPQAVTQSQSPAVVWYLMWPSMFDCSSV